MRDGRTRGDIVWSAVGPGCGADRPGSAIELPRLLERSFDVPVSLTVAWEVLGRVESWPTWAAHIRSVVVTPAGPIGPGSSGAILLRNGIRSTFRMEECRPGVHWLWAGPFLWLTVRYDHRFEALAPDRTRLTWTVDADGFGVSVLGRLFAAIYARNLDRAIPQLVATLGGQRPTADRS